MRGQRHKKSLGEFYIVWDLFFFKSVFANLPPRLCILAACFHLLQCSLNRKRTESIWHPIKYIFICGSIFPDLLGKKKKVELHRGNIYFIFASLHVSAVI